MFFVLSLLLFGTGFILFGDAGKKRLTEIAPNEVVVVSNLIIAIPLNLLLISILPNQEAIQFNNGAWGWILLGIAAICLGEFGFVSSLRRGEYSLVIPLIALVPIFAIPIGYLFLGESVGVGALLGAVLAVAGAYLMGTTTGTEKEAGLLAPLKAIFSNRSAQLMMLAVAMAPLIGAAQKSAAPPALSLHFLTLIMMGELLIFGCAVLIRGSSVTALLRKAPRQVILTGLLWSIGFGAINVANGFAPLAVVATARLIHPIAALAVGRYLFHETQASARALPVVLIAVGVLLALTLQ